MKPKDGTYDVRISIKNGEPKLGFVLKLYHGKTNNYWDAVPETIRKGFGEQLKISVLPQNLALK